MRKMKISLGWALLCEIIVGLISFFIGLYHNYNVKFPLETIQPGDFIYCQMKDEVVGDYRIGRVKQVSEDGFLLRG